jgi:ZIP family zinc transporter
MEWLIDWLSSLHPIMQGGLAALFTWFITALGAAVVFLIKNDVPDSVMDSLLGFTGGVMLAASFWSLLSPALEMSIDSWTQAWSWVPVAIGFVGGALFLFVIDQYLPHLHLNAPISSAEGVKTDWNKTVLLVLAITLHNIPEGLAIGVAFGAVAEGIPGADLGGAIALAIGRFTRRIGCRNSFKEERFKSVEIIYLGSIKWSGRAHCCCFWSSIGDDCKAYFALCPCFCCRCYDLCCG